MVRLSKEQICDIMERRGYSLAATMPSGDNPAYEFFKGKGGVPDVFTYGVVVRADGNFAFSFVPAFSLCKLTLGWASSITNDELFARQRDMFERDASRLS